MSEKNLHHRCLTGLSKLQANTSLIRLVHHTGAHQKHTGKHMISLRNKMGVITHKTNPANTMQLVESLVIDPRQSL